MYRRLHGVCVKLNNRCVSTFLLTVLCSLFGCSNNVVSVVTPSVSTFPSLRTLLRSEGRRRRSMTVTCALLCTPTSPTLLHELPPLFLHFKLHLLLKIFPCQKHVTLGHSTRGRCKSNVNNVRVMIQRCLPLPLPGLLREQRGRSPQNTG